MMKTKPAEVRSGSEAARSGRGVADLEGLLQHLTLLRWLHATTWPTPYSSLSSDPGGRLEEL